jgi:HEAT repeat protein
MPRDRDYRWMILCALALLTASGCANTMKKNGWSWPWAPEVDDAVGITTPAQRLANMQQQAEKADQQSPAEKERITGDLAKQIQEEQDPMIRRNIVMALGHYDTPAAIAVLQAAVADADSGVRIAACEAWGRRGGQEAAERLANLLSSDTNIDVRLAAARAIGKTHEKSALQPLSELLSDGDPAIQYRVVGAMKEISGKDYGNNLELWRAYARGENPQEPPGPSLAQRVKQFF